MELYVDGLYYLYGNDLIGADITMGTPTVDSYIRMTAGAIASGSVIYMDDVLGNVDVELNTDGDSYFKGGSLAIGHNAPTAGLDVRTEDDNGAGTYTSFLASHTHSTTSTTIEYAIGSSSRKLNAVSSGQTNNGYVMGVSGIGYNSGAGNIAATYGGRFVSGSYTGGTGTITNAYGVYSQILKSAGTITNGRGVHIVDVDATNAWGLYQAGTDDDNYFGGDVGIGDSSPDYDLDVGAGQIGDAVLDHGSVDVEFMQYDGVESSAPLDQALVLMWCLSGRSGYIKVVETAAGTSCTTKCAAEASYTSCHDAFFWNADSGNARGYDYDCASTSYYRYCCCY